MVTLGLLMDHFRQWDMHKTKTNFYKYDYNYQLLFIYLYLLYIFSVAMSIAPCTTILKVFRISYKPIGYSPFIFN